MYHQCTNIGIYVTDVDFCMSSVFHTHGLVPLQKRQMMPQKSFRGRGLGLHRCGILTQNQGKPKELSQEILVDGEKLSHITGRHFTTQILVMS
jgi:hypothetical protein